MVEKIIKDSMDKTHDPNPLKKIIPTGTQKAMLDEMKKDIQQRLDKGKKVKADFGNR